jgi:predicted nuclease of predicted toxin-antitoxin system
VTIWLDAHLPPAIATWLSTTYGLGAIPIRDLGFRDALDPTVFAAAKAAGVVVMTKDADFAEMVERLGSPPQILWLRCGNTSNTALRKLLTLELPDALTRITNGVPLVEIGASDDAETNAAVDGGT